MKCDGDESGPLEECGDALVLERGERDMLKMPDMMLRLVRPLACSGSGVELVAACACELEILISGDEFCGVCGA